MTDFKKLSLLSCFDLSVKYSDFSAMDLGLFDKSFAQYEKEIKNLEEELQAHGIEHIFPTHPDYPESFHHLYMPPVFLTYVGQAVWKKSGCISIVGSRKITYDTLSWFETHLSEFLKESQAVVVSGAAVGVDQRAHALSLRMGLPTVSFVPSGLLNLYPKDFGCWVKRICERGGAVVSEYSPYQEMRRHFFHQRNRMIAALSPILLVGQARRASGTMITVGFAGELHRQICVLPTSPTNTECLGGLDLICEGALLIRDAKDLKMAFDGAKWRTC